MCSAQNKKDEHYEELVAMEEELKAFRTPEGNPYRLLPLPMADAIYDINGERCRQPMPIS